MVLKKPYAFIIKHFRIIHLLLLIPMLFLITQTKQIVVFFKDYIASSYTFQFNDVLSSLASNYINVFMYLAVIIILVTLIFLSLVLQLKKKPTKLYNISIIYYIGIFILLTASFSVFQSIENNTMDATFIRIIRDLGYLIHYSQYIFVIYTVIRGVGFDIKQFDFKDDLIELEISSEDSEEFEFLVGRDTYKTKRSIHRFLRELKYYYLENKFIFIVIASCIIIALATLLYMNKEVYQKVYKENESLAFGFLNIKVNDTFISNLSYNGEVINEDKTYLIVSLNITNRYLQDKPLNYANLELKVNKQFITPSISAANYFKDYGNPFSGNLVKGNTDNSYILVYEFDKHLVSSKFSLMAFSRFDGSKGGLGMVNKEIELKPSQISSKVNEHTVNKGTSLNLSMTNLKNTKVNLLDYELTNRYEYSYLYCITNNNCMNAKDAISITGSEIGRFTLLAIDYKLELDETSWYLYSNKNYKNFFEDFMTIKYTINKQDYISKVRLQNPNNYSDKLIIKVNSNINSASKIEAIITVRNISYKVRLK